METRSRRGRRGGERRREEGRERRRERRDQRGRNNQTSVSGVWRATRASNMEVGLLASFPGLYGAEAGETAG